MTIRCEAEILFEGILELMLKLSDMQSLTKGEFDRLRALLDKYWKIDCPDEGDFCVPNKCSFARPIDWVEFHGYTSLNDLLYYFEYENATNRDVALKNKASIDTMDASWARRGGHYNP